METIKGYIRNTVFKSPHVLAVDRDEDNLLIIYQTLEIFGYTSLLTQDRQTALDLAAIYQPRLILLEISANHCEDVKIIGSLKENLKTFHIPVIGVTTFTQPEECHHLLERGCDNYLSKPYSIEDLGNLVTYYMTSRWGNSSGWASFMNSSERTA